MLMESRRRKNKKKQKTKLVYSFDHRQQTNKQTNQIEETNKPNKNN